jgi:hypothetical protein
MSAGGGRWRRRRRIVVLTALTLVVVLAPSAGASIQVMPVSNDPYSDLDAYHRTEVEPDSFSDGSTIVFAFQVARFPAPGADNVGWATTVVDGAAWTSGFLPGTTGYSSPPGPWARLSDPSVAYDPKHNQWMIASIALDGAFTGSH